MGKLPVCLDFHKHDFIIEFFKNRKNLLTFFERERIFHRLMKTSLLTLRERKKQNFSETFSYCAFRHFS